MMIINYILLGILGPIVLWTIFLLVGYRLNFVKRIRCRIGWHSAPNFESTGFDGASEHARCMWCKYEGMIDSQGNLF